MKAFQTTTAPKSPDIFDRVARLGLSLADSDKVLHRLHSLVPATEVTFANGFPHEFRDSGFRASRPGVQRIPEVIVKVQLRSPHDVYDTSRSAVTKVKNKYSPLIVLINPLLARFTPLSGRLALTNHMLLSNRKSQSYLSCTDH